MPQADFWAAMNSPFSLYSLDALKDPNNILIAVQIFAGVSLMLVLSFFFRRSKLGKKLNDKIETLSPIGLLFVRAALAISLFFSAYSYDFLGPELKMSFLPFAPLIQAALYLISFMIAVGFLTELAAGAALIIFFIGFFTFGGYVFTYLNYLGSILVLLLFGMRKWSVDGYLFGPLKRFKDFRKYGTTIVRICYGLALVYAAVTVKFLHPELVVDIVKTWNLTQFGWLFPSDPLLIAFGAGLAETAIGLFIIFGFELRLTVLVSLFYITLSLFFFRELVWPHLMLYGISFNLLVQPEIFTLDHFFEKKLSNLWLHPFHPHVKASEKK